MHVNKDRRFVIVYVGANDIMGVLSGCLKITFCRSNSLSEALPDDTECVAIVQRPEYGHDNLGLVMYHPSFEEVPYDCYPPTATYIAEVLK